MTNYDPFESYRKLNKLAHQFENIAVPTIPNMDLLLSVESIINDFCSPTSLMLEKYQNMLETVSKNFNALSSFADDISKLSILGTEYDFSPKLMEQINAMNTTLKAMNVESIMRVPHRISDQLEDSLTDRLRCCSSEILNTIPVDQDGEVNNSFSEHVTNVQSIIEKKRLSLSDICSLLTLLVTILAFAYGLFPNSQITHVEEMFQETIDIGHRLIKLQEQEIDLQQRLLDNSEKQAQSLEQLSESEDETDQ